MVFNSRLLHVWTILSLSFDVHVVHIRDIPLYSLYIYIYYEGNPLYPGIDERKPFAWGGGGGGGGGGFSLATVINS